MSTFEDVKNINAMLILQESISNERNTISKHIT